MSSSSGTENPTPEADVRRYYSMRTGTNRFAATLDFGMFLKLFLDLYDDFVARGYFQQSFGFDCVDQGWVPGTLGDDISAQMRLRIRKDHLWPIPDKLEEYSEDDLFDVVEFLYDHVSAALDGTYHSFNDCGMHYNTFDRTAGQVSFRHSMNALLRDYRDGYELSDNGEILNLAPAGIESIYDAALQTTDPENIDRRVAAAVRKFRHRSSLTDRRDAIRDLADILEYLRPQVREVLTKKDESDLFNLANNFGIRHHNDQQQTQYDKPIWYSWMFYYYLATIHAVVRLIEKDQQAAIDE